MPRLSRIGGFVYGIDNAWRSLLPRLGAEGP
jgi:hypothetical protein